MPEMNLRQPGFTYIDCGAITKNKERIQKESKTGESRYIYQKELDKACFQYDMAYGDFKDLTRRAESDKIFCDKTFSNTKNPKYDGYQRGLTSMIYKFFNKKTSSGAVKNKNLPKQELVEDWKTKSIITFYRQSLGC